MRDWRVPRHDGGGWKAKGSDRMGLGAEDTVEPRVKLRRAAFRSPEITRTAAAARCGKKA
jgi:hypothetical protein